MNLFDVIKSRRSVRRFEPEAISETVILRAIEMAILAPNSSNTQTWDFYWVQSPQKKMQLIESCLNQSAARTAAELVVFTADPKKWKRSQEKLIEWVSHAQAPSSVIFYYKKIIPFTYTWGLLNSWGWIKKFLYGTVGLFRPIIRGPALKHEQQEVAIKSCALAAQNFVLALMAQGVSSCMMEGFDERRVKKILKLSYASRVVMVVALGKAHREGTWGPQFRLPVSEVFHKI